MKMSIEIKEHESGTLIFALNGNLHGSPEGYEFQDEVRNRFSAGARRIIVDLAEVGRIDSCGIGILAAIAMSAQNAGGGLVLASLPQRIEQILGVTHFLEFVDHAGSIPEALQKLDEMNLPEKPA
jgi:anti-anti-sigma factor